MDAKGIYPFKMYKERKKLGEMTSFLYSRKRLGISQVYTLSRNSVNGWPELESLTTCTQVATDTVPVLEKGGEHRA